MKQQVLIISGGSTFASDEDFIKNLKTKEINLERAKFHLDWKDTLADDLGNTYEVFVPRMPNVTNAKYDAWAIWFERIIDLLSDNLILIGHSLGAIFLAKYLSENICNKKIMALFLVSGPFDDESSESLGDFIPSNNFQKLIEQCSKIFLMQSKDDPVVNFNELEKYQRLLPNAKTVIFEDRGHFNQEHFGEIVDLIKSL